MKNLLGFLIILALTFSLQAQDNKKVLIIGIDGVRSDALVAANTPEIDGLIETAIYSPDALNDDITISGPGWSAILCGVWSEKHLVTGNNFSGNDYSTYPSFIQRAEDFDSNLHTVSFCHWGPINDNIVADAADFKLNFGSDQEVADQAANYLAVNDPDIVFLHFDDVDHAGHGSGFSPDNPAYITAIETVDVLVGQVQDALENRATYEEEDWLILITTDHGGQGTSHGGTSFTEENVFVIASGKNIEPIVIRRDSSYTSSPIDNCLEADAALAFDSSSSVEIADTPSFNFGSTQDFTIECRVRTNVSADVSIVGNKDWDSGLNPGFVFSFSYPNGPEWKVNIGDGSNRVDINTGGEIADGEWHTLSVSFDRDGMMSMYEDGVFLSASDISNIGNIDTNAGLIFGADTNNGYSYSGEIAEVRVWNTLVDGATIENWHCQSLENTHPNYADLLGYWPMNEEEDNIVSDVSGNEHHGLNNGAFWQSGDSILVENFDHTFRLVDVPVTALQHLCIPILPEWNLDGQSLIDLCDITGTTQPFVALDIQIAPNPVTNGVLYLSGKDLMLIQAFNIYDITGKLLQKGSLSQGLNQINVSKLPAGAYLIELSGKENRKLQSRIVIP
ncbi:MAG: alkaline phosphatase family protein [Lewinella sp.]|jgi:hypothetical protein|uniref:alkaline phosphatase family protein n=1 Tax=Lewinella sp. TaxID=2004506 RepID=UPI003D6B3B89